jgi:hypothetical protein
MCLPDPARTVSQGHLTAIGRAGKSAAVAFCQTRSQTISRWKDLSRRGCHGVPSLS